jgi:hypothetical protein
MTASADLSYFGDRVIERFIAAKRCGLSWPAPRRNGVHFREHLSTRRPIATAPFNCSTFSDDQYTRETLPIREGLGAADRVRLSEVEEKLRLNGALYDEDVRKILGGDLYKRLVSVGPHGGKQPDGSSWLHHLTSMISRTMAARSRMTRSTMRRHC